MSPQTKQNIEKAMAVEALASAKYTRFAACARANENPEVARLFQIAADIDRTAHFRKEFDLDTGPCDDRENLESAIEDKEWLIEMYGEFVRQAEAAGDFDTALLFDGIRQDELLQAGRFRHALDELRAGSRCAQGLGA